MARIVDLRKGKKQEAPVRAPVRRISSPKEPQREIRRAPLRVRRRRKRWALLSAFMVFCALATYAVHWVSYMPQYTIQDIEVSGISTLDEREIQQRVYDALGEDSGFISPRNLLWYDSEKIRSALESDIFHIARASVSRDDFFSTTLRVSIDERAPFAKWCSTEERCYAIDETGFIFDPLTASSTQTFAETFTFFGGVTSTSTPLGAYVAPARFPSALSIMRTLGQAGYTPVRASIDSDTDVSIVFNTGFTLYASFGAEPPALVRNLKLVLESEPLKDNLSNLEYVDLRFGNRVFYKLKGQEAVGQ